MWSKPCVDVGLDRLDMGLYVRPARDLLGQLIDREGTRRLLEVSWQREFGAELTRDAGVGPPRGRRLTGGPLVFAPTHGDLGVSRLPRAAGAVERRDQLVVRRQTDQSVPDLARHLGSALPTRGDQDRRWFLGRGVQASALDAEMLPAMVDPVS